MAASEEIGGLTELCLKLGIYDVPVRHEQPLDVFFPKDLFERWILEAVGGEGIGYPKRGVQPKSTNNLAVYQSFQKLVDRYGREEVQLRITEHLDKLWPDYSMKQWAVFKARIETRPIRNAAPEPAQYDTSDDSESPAASTLNIGILWCTWFAGSWWSRPWSLRYGYRPPSLFASKMRSAGYNVQALMCDEKLELKSLTGSPALQDDVDILYVMTHGEFDSAGYRAELNADRWRPSKSGLGVSAGSRLSVVVFDTCNLIDGSYKWQSLWAQNLGAGVRLVLGFEGSVAIDQGSAARGHAFATELVDNGKPFAEAWLDAAESSMAHLNDASLKQAVALGVGDSAADAQSVLDSASLANMPAARSAGSAAVVERWSKP